MKSLQPLIPGPLWQSRFCTREIGGGGVFGHPVADDPQARQRFIQTRRVRVTMSAWASPNGHLVPARVENRLFKAIDRELKAAM